MQIIDGRGKHYTKIHKINRERIIKFFKDNPMSTMKSCSEKTGLSYQTIKNHVKQMRENK